jgi:hypothetical protein
MQSAASMIWDARKWSFLTICCCSGVVPLASLYGEEIKLEGVLPISWFCTWESARAWFLGESKGRINLFLSWGAYKVKENFFTKNVHMRWIVSRSFLQKQQCNSPVILTCNCVCTTGCCCWGCRIAPLTVPWLWTGMKKFDICGCPGPNVGSVGCW